ncbi:MAG: hypothetical protein ABIG44_09745 [Planctomycetota bacterium]
MRPSLTLIICALLLPLVIPVCVAGPPESRDKTVTTPPGPHEGQTRDTQPVVKPPRAVSPPLSPQALRRGPYQSVQVNVDGQGFNIVADAANEPSLVVDPTNPNRMAIGWRQFDTIESDFREAGWAYSYDAGRTWIFPGVLIEDSFRTDPVLDADTQGNFYYQCLVDSAFFSNSKF